MGAHTYRPTKVDGRKYKLHDQRRQRARLIRILQAIADGSPKCEIADNELISECYLRMILVDARRELQVRNTYALIAEAMRRKMIR